YQRRLAPRRPTLDFLFHHHAHGCLLRKVTPEQEITGSLQLPRGGPVWPAGSLLAPSVFSTRDDTASGRTSHGTASPAQDLSRDRPDSSGRTEHDRALDAPRRTAPAGRARACA